MRVEFLIGPAGSGKTFRCLAEARAALEWASEGLPLIYLTPKQATYQVERQLLASGSLRGYTRLQVLSFERLCEWVFKQTHHPQPEFLSEEGRIMVLRALLARHAGELKVFRASGRAGGFARQLSRLMRELQESRISPMKLREMSKNVPDENRLREKLTDVALLLEAYHHWLEAEQLQDRDQLIDLAAELLDRSLPPPSARNQTSRTRRSSVATEVVSRQLSLFSEPESPLSKPRAETNHAPIRIERLWLDGFARLSAQEQRLLRALAPRCERMTLAFCLDPRAARAPWHSHWFAVEHSVAELRSELELLPEAQIEVTELGRTEAGSESRPADRFANAELKHLEGFWADPTAYSHKGPLSAIGLFECADLESEATLAAQEILRYVRQGGRFRDTAVIVRQLEKYHDVLRRVFLRYEIPFFLDRREPIAHHPLAELIRGALRSLAFNWRQRDWFCALKSGLIRTNENEIDRLENLALARGWEGADWQNPLIIGDDPALTESIEELRKKLVAPFLALRERLGGAPTGKQLSEALLNFWRELDVEEQLEKWSRDSEEQGPMHVTVWEQLHEWAQNLALAFRHEAQPLKDWIPILESGLENLSVGIIPPVLDQVLLGAVDRSRNPDLQYVFVLGLNEGVFPATASAPPILSELDRNILETKCRASIGSNARAQTAQERFFGYIACTRAIERLLLTYANRDPQGAQLSPSSLVTLIQRLFPQLREPQRFAVKRTWQAAEHYCDVIAPLLRGRSGFGAQANEEIAASESGPRHDKIGEGEVITTLSNLPRLAPILSRLEAANPVAPTLAPHLAGALYGAVHQTSVSALERFGACEFWFFVESGLEAEERERFELDARQAGTFQHKVLERFHHQLKEENKTWHSITPKDACERIGRIADELIETFEEGMINDSAENRFVMRQRKERLQRLIETLIGWMPQYAFEPAHVELSFGLEHGSLPAWKIKATDDFSLALRGSIDRVDLFQPNGSDTVWCVVMDYKSRGKRIDDMLMRHGIQLQLPGYLAALQGIEGVRDFLGADKLRPAGIFFVNLSGRYDAAANRTEALANLSDVDKAAFLHVGLFDAEALDFLDKRGAAQGDQFPYRRRKDGELYARTRGPMPAEDFLKLLDSTVEQMREFGRKILGGGVSVNPYKVGKDSACAQCKHAPICRIDPWTHEFRRLKGRKQTAPEEEESDA